MLTLKKMQEILSEKDEAKRNAMIDALPEDEKKKLLAEAEKVRKTGESLIK